MLGDELLGFVIAHSFAQRNDPHNRREQGDGSAGETGAEDHSNAAAGFEFGFLFSHKFRIRPVKIRPSETIGQRSCRSLREAGPEFAV